MKCVVVLCNVKFIDGTAPIEFYHIEYSQLNLNTLFNHG